MTKSNEDLLYDFAISGAVGRASRMEVTSDDDGSAFLWGYGWALYAYRCPQGRITVYDGWEGYSSTTTKHIRHFNPDHPGHGDYSVPRAVERVEEFADARPGYKGNLGAKSFDPDGREELADYNGEITP